jgi:hypothetical protein
VNRRRIIVAAASAAAAIAATTAAVTATHAGQGAAVTDVQTTITIPGTHEVWAPPPADAAPALTSDQAWAIGMHSDKIDDGTTVQLGLITDPAGPWCGEVCDNLIDVDGTAYRAYNTLAYGYYRNLCNPDAGQDERDCETWFFLDASTGKLLTGALPRLGSSASGLPPASPSDSASPSATPSDSASPSQQ